MHSRIFLNGFSTIDWCISLFIIIVMCSTMNRSHPPSIIMGVRLARFCFIACSATALAFGFSVAHVEIERSASLDKECAAFERTAAVPISVARQACRVRNVMKENQTIANLNPKLGKVLARLVRMQEQFPKDEKGEPNHGEKPPIGMKPRAEEVVVKKSEAEVRSRATEPLSEKV